MYFIYKKIVFMKLALIKQGFDFREAWYHLYFRTTCNSVIYNDSKSLYGEENILLKPSHWRSNFENL